MALKHTYFTATIEVMRSGSSFVFFIRTSIEELTFLFIWKEEELLSHLKQKKEQENKLPAILIQN